ncbi:MAG: aspartate aminotransferase family protein [Chloroflexi bacterium]|nr:aspartate aminotransferase family protein [Chloroflexota bacterium]
MLETTTRDALVSADIEHLIHQLTRAGHHARTGPVIVESASGATLRLADGREILDGTSGLWCVNAGHGRAELADAAADQMRRLAFAHTSSGFSHQPAIELAARLASLTPGDLTAAYFTSGGAEANETAFKFARYYWRLRGQPGKALVLSHVRGYHGLTHGAQSATGLTEYHGTFGDLAEGFDKVPPPYPYRWEEYAPADIDADDIASAVAVARRIEEVGPERVAAVIMEPVLGTGGVIVPPDGYLRAVREVCDRYDVLMIADEVITGFGRTGTWFGSQHEDVVPDMMTFAKGVTSGYLPLGGVMLREHLRDAMRDAPGDPPLMHVFTYSGHPVPCAVALANLEILENEGIVDGVAAKGRRLRQRLDELHDLPEVGEIRSAGLMSGVELVRDEDTREPYHVSERPTAVAAAALERGLATRALLGGTMQLAPPLIISDEEIDRAVGILAESIVATR